jgi:hypothetical protein
VSGRHQELRVKCAGAARVRVRARSQQTEDKMGNLFAVMFLGSSAFMFVGVVVMGIMHWSEERRTHKPAKSS